MKFLWQSLTDALANIWRNKLVNILCLGIIAFTLLVLGIFQTVSFNLNRAIARLGENIEAIFYFRDGAPAAQVEEVRQAIGESPLVKESRFVDKEEAQTRFLQEFPDLRAVLAEFNASPFPASLEVRFQPGAELLAQVESLARDIRRNPAVESIQLNTDWAKKIEMAKRLVAAVGYFLGFILIFVSVFVIFNVIKLNIFYRRQEITIFKLVGATRFYIRAPFLLEGVVLGLLGGALAALLLILTLKLYSLYGGVILTFIRQMVDVRAIPPRLYLQLAAAGALIGVVSSLFSLQRFLKTRPE